MNKRTNRIWAFLLFALLLLGTVPSAGLAAIADFLSVTAAAESYSGECGADGDNVTWAFDTEIGILRISGSGKMKNFSTVDMPWYSFRMSVNSVVINRGVTAIGGQAFYACRNLTDVTISDSVQTIEDAAFMNCGFSSLTVPNSVTYIGYHAFSGCENLTEIMLPDSLAHICSYMFEGCSSLERFTIPSNVTNIGYDAFSRCTGLISIVIPISVTSINHAFTGCSNLSDVYYGGSEKQWNAIERNSGSYFDGWLRNAAIHYNWPNNADPVPTDAIAILGFQGSRTVDYRATVTFTATVENAVDGASVHWFIDGQDKGTGETYTKKEAKKSYTVQVKYMKDGKVLAASEIETVNVKTGFFAKLKAFFRALFGRLPKEVQEAYDFDLFLNLLP